MEVHIFRKEEYGEEREKSAYKPSTSSGSELILVSVA